MAEFIKPTFSQVVESIKIVANTQLLTPPKPLGAWNLSSDNTPGIRFSMYHKPTDDQIKNTEELLGWKWEDAV